MKKKIFLAMFVLMSLCAHAVQLGEEQILLKSDEKTKHLAFPHAIADQRGNLWLVYRAAENHVGSLGTLWLAKYRLSDMTQLDLRPIYHNDKLDARDPILHLQGDNLLVSFFMYNYPQRMIRQFILSGSTKEGFDWTKISPTYLEYGAIENHMSCSPPIQQNKNLILPVYFVDNFFETSSRVGFFNIDPKLKVKSIVKIHKSDDRFLLEPTLWINPKDKKNWTVLFRTAPMKEGVGSLGPMMIGESKDGGKSWSNIRDTKFIGHHPKFITDKSGSPWAGFRDLSEYDEKNYKAKITLWNMLTDQSIPIFETSSPNKHNWDCGYPSMIELEEGKFRVVYYYAKDGNFYIATKLLTM